jgi:transaldolase/transaldolase/glucose-6-phosphate isomerase
MSNNPLRELNAVGQSVWQDNIRRGELLSGALKKLIDEDGLSGTTSNPTIFEKAIEGSKDYDEAITQLGQSGKGASEIFDALAIEDIQHACDLFRPTYDATEGRDGFVSIEVSPTLAHDTAGTIAEARRLWKEVNRPNVMIKIPGTKDGLPAIEQTLSEGLNINVTLLFAVEMYEQVANRYVAALEKRAKEGKPINRVASVASFFVSRIDTLIDQQLDSKLAAASSPSEKAKLEGLKGKTAIANAKVAYRKFKEVFGSAQYNALAGKGARVQRVLWASTSTKNPKYRDVIYIETLIGPDTVNTMPPATITAFRDHGQVRLTLEEDFEGARRELAELGQVGIDLRAATQKLEDDGVKSFANDFAKLLSVVEEKRKHVLEVQRT